ncbi:MAG: hypothetical protein RL346_2139, partial [Verrucomicrobiota bacterium]
MFPNQIAIHTFTNRPWNIRECIENYARANLGGISVWRETLDREDLKTVRRLLDDSGLIPVSLVRGGFFTGMQLSEREAAVSDNLRA